MILQSRDEFLIFLPTLQVEENVSKSTWKLGIELEIRRKYLCKSFLEAI